MARGYFTVILNSVVAIMLLVGGALGYAKKGSVMTRLMVFCFSCVSALVFYFVRRNSYRSAAIRNKQQRKKPPVLMQRFSAADYSNFFATDGAVDPEEAFRGRLQKARAAPSELAKFLPAESFRVSDFVGKAENRDAVVEMLIDVTPDTPLLPEAAKRDLTTVAEALLAPLSPHSRGSILSTLSRRMSQQQQTHFSAVLPRQYTDAAISHCCKAGLYGSMLFNVGGLDRFSNDEGELQRFYSLIGYDPAGKEADKNKRCAECSVEPKRMLQLVIGTDAFLCGNNYSGRPSDSIIICLLVFVKLQLRVGQCFDMSSFATFGASVLSARRGAMTGAVFATLNVPALLVDFGIVERKKVGGGGANRYDNYYKVIGDAESQQLLLDFMQQWPADGARQAADDVLKGSGAAEQLKTQLLVTEPKRDETECEKGVRELAGALRFMQVRAGTAVVASVGDIKSAKEAQQKQQQQQQQQQQDASSSSAGSPLVLVHPDTVRISQQLSKHSHLYEALAVSDDFERFQVRRGIGGNLPVYYALRPTPGRDFTEEECQLLQAAVDEKHPNVHQAQRRQRAVAGRNDDSLLAAEKENDGKCLFPVGGCFFSSQLEEAFGEFDFSESKQFLAVPVNFRGAKPDLYIRTDGSTYGDALTVKLSELISNKNNELVRKANVEGNKLKMPGSGGNKVGSLSRADVIDVIGVDSLTMVAELDVGSITQLTEWWKKELPGVAAGTKYSSLTDDAQKRTVLEKMVLSKLLVDCMDAAGWKMSRPSDPHKTTNYVPRFWKPAESKQ